MCLLQIKRSQVLLNLLYTYTLTSTIYWLFRGLHIQFYLIEIHFTLFYLFILMMAMDMIAA